MSEILDTAYIFHRNLYNLQHTKKKLGWYASWIINQQQFREKQWLVVKLIGKAALFEQ